ncbi:CDP-alcohol phosphatidyltransferase family protein [Patescibacteria group bacterium]|nr:CDP-alcohol phosphatidyltransferase family protein [Patescibacteria group bacterium]MBU2509508.1 CDP-alcohol phosphatidyltransferase family protein [Patescibacteria group bacterium]
MKEFDDSVRALLLKKIPKCIHPNHLTLVRVVCLPFLVYFRSVPWLAVSILIFSSIFDILDGPLARIRKQTTEVGASLDATADKIFLLGTLIFACWSRVPLWIICTVVGLDIVLTTIRPIKRYWNVTTKANMWGGLKIWSQSFAVGFVLVDTPWGDLLDFPAFMLAIFFALLSLAGHICDFRN